MFKQKEYDKKFFEKINDYLPDEFVDAHVHLWKHEHIRGNTECGVAGWVGNFISGHVMDAEAYKESMRELFPKKTVRALAFGWVEPYMDVLKNNAYIGSLKDMKGLAVSLPEWSAEETISEVEKNGLAGLKPYPAFAPASIAPDDIRITDMITMEQLQAANEKEWTVVIHLPRAGRLADKANIEDLLMIDKTFPHIKLVVAHIGRAYCIENIGEAFDMLKNTENMLFDFAAHTNAEVFKRTLSVFGQKRVHYGSDMPISGMRLSRTHENGTYINTVPTGSCGDVSGDMHMRESDSSEITFFVYEAIASMQNAVIEMGLGDAAIEDIFKNNALSLMRK